MMLGEAAAARGVDLHVYCPDPSCPAASVAMRHVAKPYDDLEAVGEFARGVEAVTYEFENVPAGTAAACQQHAPVRPSPAVLAACQDRLREKTSLQQHGLPTAPWAAVRSFDDLQTALDELGTPAVLKTTGGGYDGKGQRIIQHRDQAGWAWEDLGGRPCVLEGFVHFEQELSVVAARGIAGDIVAYGPMANTHRHHILDLSVWPAAVAPEASEQALAVARRVVEALDVVGVLCIEMFQMTSGPESSGSRGQAPGGILINELAPRPHNSGHLTIEAFDHSQFDQQLLTATGQPPAAITPAAPAAAMVNLLGDLWRDGEPQWHLLQNRPDVHLHLYGKADARPGRKMGHLTVLADSPQQAVQRAVAARAAVAPGVLDVRDPDEQLPAS
jgi:5-(carboxyamino)imidazole ribonucleotide synthase